eukprot:TRINITY_DN8635_c0_g1_i1.p1 TRINITY_DN8635_c0_g1~~TRINITY_DN8635_c0_g1_i1.p1  ORF type:complete len:397 (+),score=80.67 TRINITY_DN8635_c0_g1_i1:15-1205(+)
MSTGLTFNNPGVITVSGEESPKLDNWTNNKNITISSSGLELSTSGYYYCWGTARGTVTVSKGCFYYEVTIKSRNSCRIGWCTERFTPENDYAALGADENSWGVDGAQQKKYHKTNDGVKFGDYWQKGDVIGTMIDFEQRRISYFKNGSFIGVAFNNVRSDIGLIPAISVSYDTKVVVNFGKDFNKLPAGAFGLNPTCTSEQKSSLENIFDTYMAKGQGENIIKGAGTLQLAEDLGSSGPMDPLIIILAWKFRSATAWEFDKEEWLSTWCLAGAYTLEDMKNTVQKWRSELDKEKDVFANFYSFVFDYLKQEKATAIEKNEALLAWKMLGIDKKWGLFDKWETWWKENNHKGVAKDIWVMLIRFIEKLGSNIDNYDESDCWPTAIDDFVMEALKKDK